MPPRNRCDVPRPDYLICQQATLGLRVLAGALLTSTAGGAVPSPQAAATQLPAQEGPGVESSWAPVLGGEAHRACGVLCGEQGVVCFWGLPHPTTNCVWERPLAPRALLSALGLIMSNSHPMTLFKPSLHFFAHVQADGEAV